MNQTSLHKSNTNLAAIIGLVVAVMAVGLSALLACKQMGVCQFSTGCGFQGVDGCADLGRMAASHMPVIGLPIAYLGLFYYLLVGGLFVQLLAAKKEDAGIPLLSLLVFLLVFGSVFDFFLAYKNFVTLSPCREGVWFCPKCPLCAWTYLLQLALLAVVVYLYMKESKKNPETGSLAMLLSGTKMAWPSWGAALGIALLTGLLIGTPKSDLAGPSENAGKKESPRLKLPPVKQVDRIIKQLKKNTKKVKMDTKGLTSIEGPKTAIVTIHKFADFLCPHCLHASLMLRFIRERWPNRVRIYYRYLPLDGKCNYLAGGSNPQIADLRCNSAKAAWCAGKYEKPEFFRHFYHGIFDFQNRNVPPEMDALERLAKRFGGNWAAIHACMGSQAQAGINRDLKVIDQWVKSKALESPATPILVLDGQLLGAGVPDFRSFVYWVDAMVLKKDGQKAVSDFESRNPWAKAEAEK